MEYTVLSPWAKSPYAQKQAISPRLDTLEGKTIGLYASFKEYHPYFTEEIQRQMAEKYPNTKFSRFTYIVDTQEIELDGENFPAFKKWLDGVDAVVGVGADMGSCSLYMGYNFAAIEKLGKPACLLSKHQYLPSATKGGNARAVPGLRVVTYDGPGFVPNGVDCKKWTVDTYGGKIAEMLPAIEKALTAPLTAVEKAPATPADHSKDTFTGSYNECLNWYYAMGWTNGSPIIPPTEEAVEEMLMGTDLPRDYVVTVLPPMNGEATVEKIAINGLLAGCTPVMMPLLIAAAEGLGDHDVIKLEGWTSSNASWFPVAVINGPIRSAIGINTDRNIRSPYTKAQATIGKAIAYMIMNISGCRMQLEDMSGPGSESRFGVVLAENEEQSPWLPMQTEYGFGAEDSTISLFWPSESTQLQTVNPSAFLGNLCKLWHGGFDVGAMIIIPPECAEMLNKAGYTKEAIKNYMLEYNRRPSSEIPRAAIGNNHPRPGLVFPADGLTHSARLFWNTEHMCVFVGGRDWGTAYLGGGDHGGPVCKKAALPKAWDEIVKKYGEKLPEYLDY